jgi:Ni,Fe-hydrogenase I large subunit
VDRLTDALGLRPEDLGSTLGRLLVRGIESQVLAGRVMDWFNAVEGNLASGDLALADITRWDPGRWPSESEGWSLVETPGGATGHWLRIADRRITAYQVVDGNTWNLSPRDQRGRRGALEQALVGTPVGETTEPVEVLRTVHSFDPCVACGVH